ncbi:MAG: PKD domain containing protein, partial [Fibrobacter sp.]|nr:PKD domain containing protein [Fibrobacter sp.]
LTSPDTLRWTFSDKDSDSISYDVYLGTELNPAPVVRGIKTSFYKIENNLSDGTYYWYVVASDSRFSTTGPVWNFTVNKQED